METVLKTEGLSKQFGGKLAVNDVSMCVKKGDIYGLIGKNGAGKTTLIRMAVGLASPSTGTIVLFDSEQLVEQRDKVGTVIEYPAIYPNMTARDNLMTQCKLQNIKDVNVITEILELVGLSDTGKKKAKNFSLGMKQRLAIAISLVGNPEFLILDEPTNGLDPEGIKEMRLLIQKLNRERQITVLISSHILGELSKLATRYGIIHSGKLIEEFTDEELKEKCKTGIVIQVDKADIEKCVVILKEELKANNLEVKGENEIHLYDFEEQTGLVNQALAKNDIIVNAISVEESDLEDYFLSVIGGRK
jgi:ABC-type multidrug transport system, ATPase component